MIGDVIEIERAKHSLRVIEDAPSIVSALPGNEAEAPEAPARDDRHEAVTPRVERWLAGLKQMVGIGRSRERCDAE